MDIINMTTIKQLPVPLPPVVEQQMIVAEIERRYSSLDEVERQVADNLKRARRLRQAILKRAFEGKLVPQDSSDESASELLERIRNERERLSPGKKRQEKVPARDAGSLQSSLFSNLEGRG